MMEPLVGKQADSVALATCRLNVWEGSVRSSKTVSSLVAWLDFVLHGPAGPLLMVGRTERTLRRNVIDPLTDMLGERRCRYIAGAGELWLLGRRVYVAGANDERAQEKIRGLTLAGAYVDEVSTIPESFWTMLLSRLSLSGARLLGTTNPDTPAHWLLQRYLGRAKLHLTGNGTLHRHHDPERLNLARFSFRLGDNPHLPADYLAALEAEYVGLWYRRYVLGEWVIAAGAVYDMFDPARHVAATLPPISQVLGWGVDYGTANPTHAVELALTTDGRLAVTREWRHDPAHAGRQLSDADQATALAAWAGPARPRWVAVDPSAASFRLTLHQAGWGGLQPADNEVADGIRLVASLLATDQLLIHESCTGLLEELPSYSWDDKAAQRGEDKPVKADDHGCDALRYAAATLHPHWYDRLARRLGTQPARDHPTA